MSRSGGGAGSSTPTSSTSTSTARRNPRDGRRLVHLTNHNLSGVDMIVPAVGLRVSVPLEGEVGGVRALRLGRPLAFERSAGCLSFELPRLEEFEVVLVEGTPGA